MATSFTFRHAPSPANDRPDWTKIIIRLKVIGVVSVFAMSMIRTAIFPFSVMASALLAAVWLRGPA